MQTHVEAAAGQRAHIEVVRQRQGEHIEVGSPKDPERILVRRGPVLERWERVAFCVYQQVVP